MEEKTLKINNVEFNCQTLIEFSSLINALIEMAKKQKETEKKLNEHDLKINNLIKLVQTQQKEPKEKDFGIGWQDKENELSNILNDEHIFSMNYNNSNLSNYINAETINDAPKQNNNNINNINNIITEEKQITNENDNNNEEYIQNKDEKEEKQEKEISPINSPIKMQQEEIKEKKQENQEKPEKTEKQEKPEILNENKQNIENPIINQKKEEFPNLINRPSNKDINNINNNINKNNIISPSEKKPQETIIVQKVEKSNNKNTEIISKLFQRIIVLEKKVSELVSKSNDNMLIRSINTNKQNINTNTNGIKKMKELTEKLDKEIKNLKERVDEFNIYDMFKDGGGDGSIDVSKALVKALENKQNKRFDLMDEKYKLMSTESFKNKDDIKNLNVLIEGQKLSLEKNNQKISNLIEEQKEKEKKEKELREKELEEINKQFETILQNLKDQELNYDNKLTELESKLSQQPKQQPVLVTDLKTEKKKDKRTNEMLNTLKEYNERIQELEKSLKQLLKKLNIEELTSNLSILQKEVTKKGNQGAIDEINDRIYSIDELIKQLSARVDSSQALEKKNMEDITIFTKKIESFASQVNRLSMQVIKNPKEEKPIIDLSKYIEIGAFEENKKEINKKFDKIRISFEDILRHIDEILDKLSHTPTDKDFSQYQEIVKSLMDEYKINSNKKYADKYDTFKSLKFLETQIKSVNENYNKKLEGQDNWLLAKKPLNNYLCASCEGIIRGELDKRCEYIPWNKYPNREEKYTRMGHGFSHMLQMVNDDIRKSVDNKEKEKNKIDDKEKDYNSDEDKKKHSNDKTNSQVKLPKVKLRPRNYNNINLIDDITWDKSPYDNIDKNLTLNDNSPQIMKISRIRKNISIKNNSTQEASINDENSNKARNNLIIKTLPSDLSSIDKNKDF